MLTPVSRVNKLTEGERKLSKLADEVFFRLWSYPSLHRLSGSSKHPVFKEFSDLTVFFNDNVIIFSEKDKKFGEGVDGQIAWKRWARQSVTESASQLWAAEKHFKAGGELFLDKGGKNPLPLKVAPKNSNVHLVAVCRNVSQAKKSLSISTKVLASGELKFNANASFESEKSEIFTVGDLDSRKSLIHIFDDDALRLVLSELDTISDFLNYLNCRVRAIRSLGYATFECEADLLAVYLSHRDINGFGSFPSLIRDVLEENIICPPSWLHFVKSEKYFEHCQNKQIAAEWKLIASRFSEGIVDANVGIEAQETPFEEHESVLRMWISENLIARAFLAQVLFDKYNSVPVNARTSRVVQSPFRKERAYVFVFFPWANRFRSYDDYRRERLSCLDIYANVVAYKHRQFKEIVVLGVDPRGSERSSETLIALLNDEPWTSDRQRAVEAAMLKTRTLTEIEGQHTLGRPSKGVKQRPNDICPCGSGLKFKRCCKTD